METRETQQHQSQEIPTSELALEPVASEKPGKKPTSRKTAQKKLLDAHPTFRIVVAMAGLIACLEVAGNFLYHHSIYASYQQAQCLIQDKQVEVTSSGHSNSSIYYVPEFTYQVITAAGGSPNVYPDYTGPGYGSVHGLMDTSADAQAVLDQYQIGQTYPCWYSLLFAQSKAVLVLQDYPWWGLLFTSLGTWLLGFLCAFIIEWLLYFRYRNWRLRRKGIAATGMVKKRYITFEIGTDPIKKARVPYSRYQMKQGSETVVIYYDPRHPRDNYSIATRPKSNALLLVLTLFLVMLNVMFMFAFWNA